ncbi:hypothetical protein CK203_021744 [Vitis vinifera]|uniref:Uncharacterized protein n=1 Tax=Vitis vinifera TaxID=29760 RepID=A0A438J4X9_VITVI|nr:hypothetical protein CK203_021744 [Vitis vinifera]
MHSGHLALWNELEQTMQLPREVSHQKPEPKAQVKEEDQRNPWEKVMKVMGKCQHHERIEKKAWKVPVEKAMMGGSDKAMEKEDSCKLERVVAGSVAQSQKWAIKVSFTDGDARKSSGKCGSRACTLHTIVYGGRLEFLNQSWVPPTRFEETTIWYNGIAAKWCPETNTFVFRGVKPPLRLRLGSAQKACQSVWLARFMGTGSQLEHEAFLSLWLSSFSRHLQGFKFVERSSCCFKQKRKLWEEKKIFLDFHFWHHFNLFKFGLGEVSSSRPSPKPIEFGEPIVARWHKIRGCNVGLALDTARASFQWRPYARAVDNWVSVVLIEKGRRMVLPTWGGNANLEWIKIFQVVFLNVMRVLKLPGAITLRWKPMVPLILRFFLQHKIPQNGEIPMMVEEMSRYKQGDSDDEDKMMAANCRVHHPQSAKVGAIRQQLVMKYLGVAAGGSEKAMEGENGSKGGSSALMEDRKETWKMPIGVISGTGTMNGASGEVMERAAKCRTGIAAIVGGSEKGVEDAIEIKEQVRRLVLVQLRYQDWNLKPGCASLRRWLLDSKQKDLATAFEKRTYQEGPFNPIATQKQLLLVHQPSLVLHKLI